MPHSIKRHFTSFSAQHTAPDWWTPLYQEAANSAIFLSAEWMETWLHTYGNRFEGNWIWWTHDEKVIGGCLLLSAKVRVKMFSFQSIFLNAGAETIERSPLSEFNDVLYVSGYEDLIAQDLISFLSELRWDRFVLMGCPNEGIIGRVVQSLPGMKVEIEQKSAPYVNLLSLKDQPYENYLSSKTRGHVRRTRKVYEKNSGPVSIISSTTLESAMQYFQEMAELHNSRWISKGKNGSFSNDLVVEFHKSLIQRLWPSKAVDLFCVKAGENNVGILYNFVRGGKVYCFQTGFSYDQNNQVMPGFLTHSLAIETYRTQGLHEYDFLAGDAKYKKSLATHERHLFWATCYRNKGNVRLFLMMKGIKALLRKIKTPKSEAVKL